MGLVQPGGTDGVNSCTLEYQLIQGQDWPGGLPQGNIPFNDCRDSCSNIADCYGFEYTPGGECWHHMDPNIQLVPGSPGLVNDVYIKLWLCMGCIYICYPSLTMDNLNFPNEDILDDSSPDDCMIRCQDTQWCQSVDYDSLSGNCFLHGAETAPVDQLIPKDFLTHYKKVMCLGDEPCENPPRICRIRDETPCILPPGTSCGVGTIQQLWHCEHGNEFLPETFTRTRRCCDTPCEANESGFVCSNPSPDDCLEQRNPRSEDKCWAEDCCWIPRDPEDSTSPYFCAKKRPHPISCDEVYPACEGGQ